MMLWHGGTQADFGEPLRDYSSTEYKSYRIGVGLTLDGSIKYKVRYWKDGDTPWTDKRLVTPDKFPDAIKVFVFISIRDGHPQVEITRSNGKIEQRWIRICELPELGFSRLIIDEKDLFFRHKKFIGIGASPRQLLHVMKGYSDPMPWTPEKFIEEFKRSGIKYVRVDVVDDYNLTVKFAKEMSESDIVVSYTMADGDRPHFGYYREHIKNFKHLDNVIVECWNELNQLDWVNRALEIADYALSEGMIVSGGGWGWSHDGETASAKFMERFKGQVWVQHRPYTENTLPDLYKAIREARKEGFIVDWNEILMKPYQTGIRPDQLESAVRQTRKVGASLVNLYQRCEEFMGLMGRLCQEFNEKNMSTFVSS